MSQPLTEKLFLEKMRIAVESSMDGIALLTAEGEYYFLNDVHVKMFGYQKEDELLGKSWQYIYHQEEIDRINQEIFPQLIQEGKWRGETLGKSKTGEPVYQEITLTILEDGGIICVCRDIADRIRKQKELLLRDNIIAKTNSMVIITNANREITWVNESFTKITGYEKDEVVGKNPGKLLQGPNSSTEAVKKFREALERKEDYQCELLNYKKDGTPYWVDIRSQPILNSKGEIEYYFATEDNITERKNAEKKLAENQLRLEMAIEVSGAALWDWDIKNNIVYYSSSWKKALGYEEHEIGNKFEEWSTRVHPEDIQKAMDSIQSYLEGSTKRYECELRLRNKKGQYLWFLDRGTINGTDQAGKPTRLTGMAFNITQIKEAQEEINRTEKRYRQVLEASGAALWELDTQTGNVLCTREFTLLFGLEEFVSNGGQVTFNMLYELVHPDDRPMIQKAILEENNNSTRKIDIEYRQRKLNKTEYEWYHIQGGSSEIDSEKKTLKVLGYCTSIQGRKNAEEKLRESEARWNAALEGSAFGVFDWNLETSELYFSPMLKKLYGYSPDELSPTPEFWIENTHPEDKEMLTGLITGSNMFPDHSFRLERRILHRNGEYRWFESRGIILTRKEDGSPARVVGSVLDTSERKGLEEELIRARDAAELNVRTKRRFLANISHEIRTPIHAIVGIAEQLEKLLKNVQEQEYLHVINESAHHLLSIISDVIDISKIEEGKIVLENNNFQLKECVYSGYSLFADAAERKGIRYSIDFDQQIDKCYKGDAAKIRQLLLNVISNAVKFTEKGIINIDCRLLKTENDVETISLVCTDTGIGMSDEMQKRLYDNFSQEDESFVRRYGGSGLGLAITRELVKLMQGTIDISSEKHIGTTVEIILPLQISNKIKQHQEEVFFDKSLLENINVLVAEDNPFNRMLMQIMFKNHDIMYDMVESGSEAIAKAMENKYDIILMDIQMPGMDGVEAMQEIRKNLGTELPIVAVTANAIESELEEYIQKGMTDFLTKPFEEKKLLQKLVKTLQKTPVQ